MHDRSICLTRLVLENRRPELAELPVPHTLHVVSSSIEVVIAQRSFSIEGQLQLLAFGLCALRSVLSSASRQLPELPPRPTRKPTCPTSVQEEIVKTYLELDFLTLGDGKRKLLGPLRHDLVLGGFLQHHLHGLRAASVSRARPHRRQPASPSADCRCENGLRTDLKVFSS